MTGNWYVQHDGNTHTGISPDYTTSGIQLTQYDKNTQLLKVLAAAALDLAKLTAVSDTHITEWEQSFCISPF